MLAPIARGAQGLSIMIPLAEGALCFGFADERTAGSIADRAEQEAAFLTDGVPTQFISHTADGRGHAKRGM